MPKKKEPADETNLVTAEHAASAAEHIPSGADLLELNAQERGVTREDSEDTKWAFLAGAARRHQVLTGTVSSFETNSMGTACAVDFEGLRVVIPAREMLLQDWPEAEQPPAAILSFLGRMLGATIDFIPAGVEIKNRVAVGSRKAALLQRQQRYYASGRVKPGILMACRVIGISRNTLSVEACGVDTEIYARNISWQWFSDIADLYAPGDLVVARVVDVGRDDETGTYRVSLSIKEATDNPDLLVLQRLEPGNNYFGTVTGVKDQVYFVRLQVGANAKTKLYRSREMPSRMDTVSFRVTTVDEENGLALGFITRIIKHYSRLG